MATLEADLGVVLFSCGRCGVYLTLVGEEIVRARQVMYLIEDIFNRANLAKGLRGGSLRVSAAFRSAATHILLEVMDFCRSCPAAVSIAENDDTTP